jgi:hypothetical protein
MDNTFFYNTVFEELKDLLGVYKIGDDQIPAINRNTSREYSNIKGLEIIVKDGIYTNVRVQGDYASAKIFFVHLIQHVGSSNNLVLAEKALARLGYSFESRFNESANITNELLIYKVCKFIILNCPCEDC